jgi:hypothetical protein
MTGLIEEGGVASKSPHLKFGSFLSISQQAVSADITNIQLLVMYAIFE